MTEHAKKLYDLPIMRRESVIDPASINEADRSFDIVWTTGARRITWCWDEGSWGGLVEEELDLAGADLSRLNNGAPYFKDHASWSIDNQIGVHVDGSCVIDLVKKEGRAKIRLSKNAYADRYWNDIKDKILRQTSVGYQVNKYVVTREEGRLPLYRAVEWTPLENSQVGIGADPGAQVRSANAPAPKLFGCSFEYQNRTAITQPKEEQRAMPKNKVTIPNQTSKRSMTDDQKTKTKEILKEYAVAEDKLDECCDKIAALMPEETAAGAGEMAAIGKELGCRAGASAAEILKAAENVTRMLEAAEAAAEGNDEDAEFEANEKKGLHRKLDEVSKGFARELFNDNPELYRAKVAKVKPLDSKSPEANPVTRKALDSHVAESEDNKRAAAIEKEEKRLLELNPKLTAGQAYKRAFENVKNGTAGK